MKGDCGMGYLVWVVLVCALAGVNAGNTYITQVNVGAVPLYWRYVVVTQDHTVLSGDAPTFAINMELSLVPADARPDTEILLFHTKNLHTKVYTVGDSWCCTEEAYLANKCSAVGELNIRGVQNWTKHGTDYNVDETGTIIHWTDLDDYDYDPTTKHLRLNEKFTLNTTGVWYFFLAQCNHTHTALVNGIIQWKNPYGYLSGLLFPYLPMYICLSIAFLALLLVWSFFLVKYRENLMGLQHAVTATLSFALIENVLWSYDYISYNIQGDISNPVNMVGALLTTGKLTTIRTLILLVAIGYSITVPTLESKVKIYVVALTVTYAIASAVEEYVWVIKTMALDFPEPLEIVVQLVLVLTNFVYVGWVGYSLYHQYKKLTEEKQTQKMSMYKTFITALVVFILISGILYFLQITFVILNLRDDYWQVWWFWDAYWEVGYFLVVLLIAYLWWPNENNERYAYSLQLQNEDDNELADLEDDDSPPVQPLEVNESDEPKELKNSHSDSE